MAETASGPQTAQNAGVNPWLIAVSVMLATFMEVLDTAIASVALPYIAGSLSASNDQATWVLTSYLVANAVILPTSNWAALRFGRKRFLVTCITIFTIASFFCGAAPTLGFMLLARVIQGAGGGGVATAVTVDPARELSAGEAGGGDGLFCLRDRGGSGTRADAWRLADGYL